MYTLHRFTEPLPREDKAYACGPRTLEVILKLWRIMGGNGEVRGEADLDNATYRKPIAEHVKNILRGREKWGLRHRLAKAWAQLPAGKLELSDEAAYRVRARKRGRAASPEHPPRMLNLDAVA
jgi:hypothetical protein